MGSTPPPLFGKSLHFEFFFMMASLNPCFHLPIIFPCVASWKLAAVLCLMNQDYLLQSRGPPKVAFTFTLEEIAVKPNISYNLTYGLFLVQVGPISSASSSNLTRSKFHSHSHKHSHNSCQRPSLATRLVNPNSCVELRLTMY